MRRRIDLHLLLENTHTLFCSIMAQGVAVLKQGFTAMKQIGCQLCHMYTQMTHVMKTNPILRPAYKWWETRFWLKEESCKF